MQAARGASLTPSDADAGSPPDRRPRRLGLFATVAVTGYAADLLTKQLALAHLSPAERTPLLGDLLGLTLVFNPGAAFSLGTSYTVVISAIAVVATLATLWLARRVRSAVWAVGLGTLLAGVTGNLTDRLLREPSVMRGHVVDFLSLPSFPVFNVADVLINLAAGLVILQAVRGVRIDGTREPARGTGRR